MPEAPKIKYKYGVQVWDETTAYSVGDQVVYKDVVYRYFRDADELDEKSDIGVKPNVETQQFTAIKPFANVYTSPTPEEPYGTWTAEEQTTTRRSWIPVDWIEVLNPDYDNKRVLCNSSALQSAANRGLDSLSDKHPPVPPSEEHEYGLTFSDSYPAFNDIVFNFTDTMLGSYDSYIDYNSSRVLKQEPRINYEQSWDFYERYGNAGLSTSFGKSGGGEFAPYAAVNDYLTVSAGRPTFSSGTFTDNAGYFELLVHNYDVNINELFKDNGIVSPVIVPTPTPQEIDFSLTYTLDLGAGGITETSPNHLNATMSMGWYGQTINYRAYTIYFETVLVELRPPYFIPVPLPPLWTPPDPVPYYVFKGGHKETTGNGSTTPITEKWVGPYSPPVIVYSNNGSVTIETFGSTTPQVPKEETITVPIYTYFCECNFVWKLTGAGLNGA